MKKIQLRKRKRKVYFQYGSFKPLKYYKGIAVRALGEIGTITGIRFMIQ